MPKSPIDLGELQTRLQNARKTHSSNSKALGRAQDAADRSKIELERATEALREASRNVLAN